MPELNIRPAVAGDVPTIMGIIEDARVLLGRQGSVQWQDEYPARADIEADVASRTGRVLAVDGQLAAYGSLTTAMEPVYEQIQQGHWQYAEPYSTLHRVAISAAYRGQHLAVPFMRGLIAEATASRPAVRVDTATVNLGMQHILEELGFVRRGVISWDFEAVPVVCYGYEFYAQRTSDNAM